LGKAYIIDHAVKAVRNAWPSIEALLLNIGGDIVVWGRSCEIAIADPGAWYDNAPPITIIDLQNAAVATSGTYARGAHLTDARSGQSLKTNVSATVVAEDAVTANALATTLCLTRADYGVQLAEATPGAEALRIASGVLQRTSGFALRERPFFAQTACTHKLAPWIPADRHHSANVRPFQKTSVCGRVGGGPVRQTGSSAGFLG
jgi:thiamine biosynthesis lipoprotein